MHVHSYTYAYTYNTRIYTYIHTFDHYLMIYIHTYVCTYPWLADAMQKNDTTVVPRACSKRDVERSIDSA